MSIDSFTSIDNELRALNQKFDDLLKQNREQIQLLNAILLKKAVDIDLTLPEGVGSELTKALTYKYKTVIKRWNSQIVASGNELLLIDDKNYAGYIAEVNIITSDAAATNKNYNLEILADNENVYSGSWDNYNAVNGIETDVSAFDDGTYYVLNINLIAFTTEIRVKITNVLNDISFTRVMLKLHKRVED